MLDEEEKKNRPMLDCHSLNIESLKAGWADSKRSDNYQDHAVGAKVCKNQDLFAKQPLTNLVMQLSLEHSDKPLLRESNQLPKDVKVNNHGSHFCACGNPGHLFLDEWYLMWNEKSIVKLGVFKRSLDDDLLDIEKCIEEIKPLVPLVHLVDGCCTNCRSLLDGIPAAVATSEPAWQEEQEQRRHPVSLPYFPHVAAFFASVVRGCKLCTMWEQEFRYPMRTWPSLSLGDFFKFENRLKCLGKDISFGAGIRKKSIKGFISTVYKSSNLSQSPDLSLFLTRPCVLQDVLRVMGGADLIMTGTDNRGMFLDPISEA
jgi:hypothetical protein